MFNLTVHQKPTQSIMRFLPLCLTLSTAFAKTSRSTEPFATQIAQSPFGVFLPREFDYGAFAASVVNVCSQTTTWALQCTGPATAVEGEQSLSTAHPAPTSCGSSAPFLTITEAESILAFSAPAARGTDTVLVHESCNLSGDWSATCVEEYAVNKAHSTSTYSAKTTLTGSDFNM
jgi:hypothetical protein